MIACVLSGLNVKLDEQMFCFCGPFHLHARVECNISAEVNLTFAEVNLTFTNRYISLNFVPSSTPKKAVISSKAAWFVDNGD